MHVISYLTWLIFQKEKKGNNNASGSHEFFVILRVKWNRQEGFIHVWLLETLNNNFEMSFSIIYTVRITCRTRTIIFYYPCDNQQFWLIYDYDKKMLTEINRPQSDIYITSIFSIEDRLWLWLWLCLCLCLCLSGISFTFSFI